MAVALPALLALHTPYEWHDAVALVLQLIAQTHRPGNQQPEILPDLRGITLLPDGSLDIEYLEGRTTSMMPGAAQLLQQLLSGKEQPPALAAFARRSATAHSGEAAAAIEAFADTLLGWERPDRLSKLRALHADAMRIISERGGHQGVSDTTTPPETREPFASQPAVVTAARPERLGAPANGVAARRGALWSMAFVFFAMATAVTYRYATPWVFLRLGAKIAPALSNPLPEETARGTDTPPDPSAAGVAETRRPAVRPSARATQPTDASALAEARQLLARARTSLGAGDYKAAEFGASAAIESLRSDASASAADLRDAAGELIASANAAAAAALQAAALQYAPGDAGVQPAQPLSILPPSPVGGQDSTADLLELHIDRNGVVEKVTFLRGPSVRNRSLASVAKAWRFRPAMKDGRPVRFVTRIAIDTGGEPH